MSTFAPATNMRPSMLRQALWGMLDGLPRDLMAGAAARRQRLRQ